MRIEAGRIQDKETNQINSGSIGSTTPTNERCGKSWGWSLSNDRHRFIDMDKEPCTKSLHKKECQFCCGECPEEVAEYKPTLPFVSARHQQMYVPCECFLVAQNINSTVISSTPVLRGKVKRVLEMMLNLYGMRLTKDNQFELTENFKERLEEQETMEDLKVSWNLWVSRYFGFKETTYLPNLAFYKNKIRSEPNGDLIENILSLWYGDYHILETNHSYMKWLFPNRTPRINLHAHTLLVEEALGIRNNKVLRNRVRRAFEMMLNFYGMRLTRKNQFTLVENYEERLEELNQWGNHDFLRITRILLALKELGHKDLMLPWLKFLAVLIYMEKYLDKARSSFEMFWVKTLDVDEEIELNTCKNEMITERYEKSGGTK